MNRFPRTPLALCASIACAATSLVWLAPGAPATQAATVASAVRSAAPKALPALAGTGASDVTDLGAGGWEPPARDGLNASPNGCWGADVCCYGHSTRILWWVECPPPHTWAGVRVRLRAGEMAGALAPGRARRVKRDPRALSR